MKTFYSAQEIEDLARQGLRELVVDDSVVLTDLARDTADRVGLRLVSGARIGANGSRPAAAPAPAGGSSPSKPRGCQHGPSSHAAGPAPAAVVTGNGANSKVVDDLVSAVRQLSRGN